MIPNLLFSSLFISTLLTLAFATHPMMNCEPKSCGNVTNITYPFWLSGRQPSYCGFPAFELTCKDDSPFLEMSYQEEYHVRNIFYDNQSLVIADAKLVDSDCPIFHNHLSFALTPFNISSANKELFLFFNCSKVRSDYFNISCAAYETFAYLGGDYQPPEYLSVPSSCQADVIMPVLGYPGANSSQYSELLKSGFLLEWTVSSCSDCRASNGQCGYSNETSNFICICPDRLHWKSCKNNNSANARTIAIGISVGAVGFITMCCLALFLYKRRNRQQRSGLSNLLSQSTSSKLSSKKDPKLGQANYQTHIFSYEELQEATNSFDVSRELGDGGFGTVYKGKLRDGRIVAVKHLYENNYRRLEQFMNEVDILSRIRHQNLVTLYGCTSHHSRELLLVYEFIPNGTVADHLHGPLASEGGLPWPIRMSIAIETADALAYLHAIEPQIIHRDIKTNNILLDNSFHVKVADFGLSRLFPLDATHVSTAPQGTPGYVDPEYHQCYQLTDKSDVYSFGVVLVELISSKPAVDISRQRHEINLANMAVHKIQNCQLDQLVDPGLGYQSDLEMKRMITQVAELASRCLQLERDIRPCIKEVLEVLRGIESGGCKVEINRGQAAEVPTREESRLLKNVSPYSPDSVTERLASTTSITPNSSG